MYKAEADPQRVRTELLQHEIIPESLEETFNALMFPQKQRSDLII